MSHGKPRDPRKEQHWRRLIELWQSSDLTVQDFCACHQLTPASFYAWRRELQQRDAANTFVPVRVLADDQPAYGTPIEISLAGGRYVRVTPGFDPATLRQLLQVLEEARAC